MHPTWRSAPTSPRGAGRGVITDPNVTIPDQMLAVVKTEAGPGAELKTVPVPEVGPNDVLIRVQAASICGTDLHIFNWDPWAQERIRTPRIFGHESAGVIAAMGESVQGLALGDLVSVETHIVCGQCYACRTGQANVCQNIRIVGVDTEGAFAEYLVIPAANAWKNDPGMPPEIAAVQEPFGNAVYTALSGAISARSVAVFGCGPIGIMAVGVARMSGATSVYAVDVNPYRLDLARRLGARAIFNSDEVDVVAALLEATGGIGVDVVLEMSGHPTAIHNAFRVLRNGGRASLLGLPSRPVEMDLANEIIFKGATVQGISGRLLFETWYQGRALQRAGLDLSPVITHRLPLTRFREAMDILKSGQSAKVVLFPTVTE